MRKRHKIKIDIVDKNKERYEILNGEYRYIPERLLKLLFGDFCEVLAFRPGKTIAGIVIEDVKADTSENRPE